MEKEKLESLLRGKNINFLIGAGASLPTYPTLRLDNTDQSFEDIVSSSQLNSYAKRIMYIYYYLKWLYPMTDIEEWNNNDIVNKNYVTFIKKLYDYLQTESNESPKRINIFTTNYDFMFEKSFDYIVKDYPLIFFNDGSRGFIKRYIGNENYYLNVSHSGYNDNYKREIPTINLAKIHGSLSWIYDEDSQKIMVDFTRQRFDDLYKLCIEILSNITLMEDDEDIENEFYKEIENCFNGENTIENLNNRFNSDYQLDEFEKQYNELMIINPNKYKFNKTVSEQHYYQLIRSFSYELEKNQAVLIVFGFSFADEHIRSIFERSLSNPELLVIIICYDGNSQRQMQQMFGKYKNVMFLPEEDKISNSNDDGKTNGDFKYLLDLLGDLNE